MQAVVRPLPGWCGGEGEEEQHPVLQVSRSSSSQELELPKPSLQNCAIKGPSRNHLLIEERANLA